MVIQNQTHLLRQEDVFNKLSVKADNSGPGNVSSWRIHQAVSTSLNSLNNTFYWQPEQHSLKGLPLTLASTNAAGIIGNTLVMLMYLRTYKKITPFKFLIIHLAACDLLFSCAQMAEIYTWLDSNFQWTNKVGCQFSCSIVLLGSLASIGTILVITVDRFQGITKGIPKDLTDNHWPKVALRTSMIWCIGIGSVIPTFISAEIVERKCPKPWHKAFGNIWRQAYSVYLLLVFCVIPVVLMAIMHGIIILKLRKPIQLSVIHRNMQEAIVRKRKKQDIRIVKILATIVVAFVICVLPQRIVSVVISFSNLTPHKRWQLIVSGYIPYAFYATVNPLIYSIIDKDFRKELIDLMTTISHCKCDRHQGSNYGQLIYHLKKDSRIIIVSLISDEVKLLPKSDKIRTLRTEYALERETCF